MTAHFFCPRSHLWQMKFYSFLSDMMNIGVKWLYINLIVDDTAICAACIPWWSVVQ